MLKENAKASGGTIRNQARFSRTSRKCVCPAEMPGIVAQELANSLKLRRVPRPSLKDWPDDERGREESQPETRASRKNMLDTLKDAGISECRSAMRSVEGIHQRSPSEKNLQADGSKRQGKPADNPDSKGNQVTERDSDCTA